MGKQLAVNVDKAKWSGLSRGTSQLIEARGLVNTQIHLISECLNLS